MSDETDWGMCKDGEEIERNSGIMSIEDPYYYCGKFYSKGEVLPLDDDLVSKANFDTGELEIVLTDIPANIISNKKSKYASVHTHVKKVKYDLPLTFKGRRAHKYEEV